MPVKPSPPQHDRILNSGSAPGGASANESGHDGEDSGFSSSNELLKEMESMQMTGGGVDGVYESQPAAGFGGGGLAGPALCQGVLLALLAWRGRWWRQWLVLQGR